MVLSVAPKPGSPLRATLKLESNAVTLIVGLDSNRPERLLHDLPYSLGVLQVVTKGRWIVTTQIPPGHTVVPPC